MASGWLNHKQLQIVKGVGRIPGDTYSAEPDPVVVNLMSGLITLVDWSPNIPSVKSGGVWVDSPLTDGRQLLAANAGNVTENISVLISDTTLLGMQKAYDSLNQMALDCRNYWQTAFQTDPVYLLWSVQLGTNTPLPQYALISNIELSPEYLDSPVPTIRVSVSIEREPYWRGVPPGANPKYWTYYVNASHPQFDINGATLVTGSDHLITQTITNKFEWTPAAYGLQSTPLVVAGQSSQNYIDISAAQVPGDAPALVEMSITVDVQAISSIYIGRSSKQQSGKGHDGINRVNALVLNAGDGNNTGVVTKTAAGAANGVVSNGGVSPNYLNGIRTVTGVDANWVTACQWGGNAGANGIKLDREFFRGTFAVFCRCTNSSAAAPVVTDMQIRLFVEEFEDNAANQSINSVTLQAVNPQISNTPFDYNSLSYMGVLTLPFENRAVQSPLGYGIQLQNTNSNLRISLQLQVLVATANRRFEVVDLIFMPIDEGMAQISQTVPTASVSSVSLLDNTGYFMRGEAQQVALSYITNADSGGVGQEVRGTDITLLPNIAQRLYFITEGIHSTGNNYSPPSSKTTVRLNIVPRWAGIRNT